MTHPSVNSIVERLENPWRETLDRIIKKCRLSVTMDMNTTFNPDGSAALAELLERIAAILDDEVSVRDQLAAADSSLSRIKEETIEECARAAENPRFAGLTRVGLCKGPHWAEETGVAELMNSHARMIASAIRSLGSTGGDKDLAG